MAFQMPDIAVGYRLLSVEEQTARIDPSAEVDHVSPPPFAPARRFNPEVQHYNHSYNYGQHWNDNHGRLPRPQLFAGPPPIHNTPYEGYYQQYVGPPPVDHDQPFGFPQQALPPFSHIFPPFGPPVPVRGYLALNQELIAPLGHNQPASPNFSHPSYQPQSPRSPDYEGEHFEPQSPESEDREVHDGEDSEDDDFGGNPSDNNSRPGHSSVRPSLPDYPDSEGDPDHLRAGFHVRRSELPSSQRDFLDHLQRNVRGDDVLRDIYSLEREFAAQSANIQPPRDVPRRSLFGGRIEDTHFFNAPVPPAAGAPSDRSSPIRNFGHRLFDYSPPQYRHRRIQPSLPAWSGPPGSISPSSSDDNDMPPAQAASGGNKRRAPTEDDEVLVIPDSDDIPESSSPVQLVEARPAKRRNARRTSTATSMASASATANQSSAGALQTRRSSHVVASASTTAGPPTMTSVAARREAAYQTAVRKVNQRMNETPAIKRSASPYDFNSPEPDDLDVIDLVGAESLPGEEAEPEKPKEKNIVKLAKFQCVICMDDCTDMTVTHCGHLFCSECLHSALHIDATKKTCPVCRQKIDVNPPSGRFTNRSKGFWPLEIKVMTRRKNEKRPART